MKILAIETSCDETAVAILETNGSKRDPKFRVLSHIVSSQIKLHMKFGGVVPNLARREHEKNLVPLLMEALKQSGLYSLYNAKNQKHRNPSQPPLTVRGGEVGLLENILDREQELLIPFKKSLLPLAAPDIDVIAVTYGPGLAPALWVGVNFAKALGFLWNKPLIPVNHMAGHFYSALISSRGVIPAKAGIQIQKKGLGSPIASGMTEYKTRSIKFPALALLVSGAHTELALVKKHGDFTIIGATRDDAAGEAFDKVGRMLGFGYPGGPVISKLADSFRHSESRFQRDEESRFKIPLRQSADRNDKARFPRPMIRSKNYDFSFSGLKTAVLYFLRDLKNTRQIKKLRPAIAHEFQNAVVDVLVAKTIRAAKEFKVKTVTLGGGVAANTALRIGLQEAIQKEFPDSSFLLPDPSLTGDNALMIALAAYFCGKRKRPDQVQADANVTL